MVPTRPVERAMHSSPIVLFLTAAALCAACGTSHSSSAPHVCTQIGCVNTVKVILTGTGASNVLRVEASAPGGTPLTWDCSSTTPCTDPSGVFFDIAPDTLVVSVVTATGTTTVTVVPAYTLYNPNGPDCPPTCKTATVAIDVSA